MKVTYDPEVDVPRILPSNAVIEESDREKIDVILDYDQDGNAVGMEILNASKRIENPRSLEYALTGQTRSRTFSPQRDSLQVVVNLAHAQ